MRIVSIALAALLTAIPAQAQALVTQSPTTQAPATQVPAPQAPAPQAPGTQVPSAPGAPVPPTAVPVTPVPVAPLLPRAFTAKTGLLFNTVRPERVLDFETVVGLLKDALAKSTDPGVRAQAQGWRVFKATEPGPNATVLYVFIIDPAIPGVDYGLGRILADAYPDRIQEIWKLYQGSVTGGGSLLNLTPVEGPPAVPATPGSPLSPVAPTTPESPVSPVGSTTPPAPTAPVLAP